MAKQKSTWKHTERRIAKQLGGERIPVSGRHRGDAPDVRHELFSIEIKHRKSLPAWLHNAMAQAVASVRGNQCPIAILHQSRQRHDDDFVVIKLCDFKKHFNKPIKDESATEGE